METDKKNKNVHNTLLEIEEKMAPHSLIYLFIRAKVSELWHLVKIMCHMHYAAV